MRNKILTTALLIVSALLLTACTIKDLPVVGKLFSGKVGIKIGKITLNVWGLWENPEVIAKIVQKYQEAHPNVTINYDDRSVMKPTDYKDRVFSRINEKDAPDIIQVHNSWVGSLKGSLSAMPASLMDEKAFASSFYPVARDSAVFNGSIYAIPLYYDGLVLVYNKGHFKDIGQLEPPTAWEEFRRLALELTVRGERGVIVKSGAAIGNADNIVFFSDILGALFSQARALIPNGLDSVAARDALLFYTNFVKEDQVWDGSFPEASTAFVQEKTSMIFVPSWEILNIVQARPDLNVGVAPLPQAIAESPATWGSFWMDVVPSGSENKAAAWDFLKFLAEADQQQMLFNEASKYRAFGPAYSLVSLSPQLSTNAYLKALLDTAPYAKSAEISARAGNDAQVNALKDAVNEVLSGSTAEQALKKAKDIIIKAK